MSQLVLDEHLGRTEVDVFLLGLHHVHWHQRGTGIIEVDFGFTTRSVFTA